MHLTAPPSVRKNIAEKAFTLIELSIVLVIIGLIVGGILVGQNLIAAAAVRAQVSQIEKYNTAVNTFRGKYGYLPGDIPNPDATRFGFVSRGSYAGEGDGNGVLEGILSDAAGQNCGTCLSGETLMFWADLSLAGLLDGNFSLASPNAVPVTSSQPVVNTYLPLAKLNNGNNIFVFSYGGVNYL